LRALVIMREEKTGLIVYPRIGVQACTITQHPSPQTTCPNGLDGMFIRPQYL
jgi:hypothetical protein